MFRYTVFETAYGSMGAVLSDAGLHMIVLPRKKADEVKKELESHYLELARDDAPFKKLSARINDHLSGKTVKFTEKMDLSGSTPFELKVWDVTMGIPRGEVRSYEWVAKQMGNAKEVRAVGQALGRNRLPLIIPCHRVIRKEGDLGGFSGGVELKRLLLKLEGYLLC
ncbi:MAG TPA: methylated-DNA--[protein]-cysteine S-methyltransferase [Candidatus Omnitrophota bacterium]|nr:methylated-DNA--[protein]-cysteine S-methyltransferase [Candidatus Omnitrophota bacterium]